MVVDFAIDDELAGERPPGGVSSWAEHWHQSINALSEGRENAERYISYIRAERQERGLPPIDPR